MCSPTNLTPVSDPTESLITGAIALGSTVKHRRYRILILLSLLSAITYLDRVCISIAGPAIQRALQLTPAQWGWVGSVFAISYTILEIPSGYKGDRIGARAVLTKIVILWSGFTALTGFVWNYSSLLIARFLFGAAEAGAYPNICVSLFRWFPTKARARATSIVLAASEFGIAVAPLIVIPIQTRYGWRVPFLILGLIGVVWVVVWRRWYRDNPNELERRSCDSRGDLVDSVAASSFPWKTLLRNRNVLAIVLAGFGFRYGIYFFQFWLPTYLVKRYGYSEASLLSIARLYAAGALVTVIGGLVSDLLVERMGLKWARRVVPFCGLTFSAVCLALTPLLANSRSALVWLSVSYCGQTFALATSWTACMDVGGRFAGVVSGARNTAANAGSIFSSLVFGYMLQGGVYDAALIPVAAMTALSGLLCLRVDSTDRLFPQSPGYSETVGHSLSRTAPQMSRIEVDTE
jgi:MFS transporter, ACS family, glucarate transporter